MFLLLFLIGKLLDYIRLDYHPFCYHIDFKGYTQTDGILAVLFLNTYFFLNFSTVYLLWWFFWESPVLQALSGGPIALSSTARCSIAHGFKQSGYDELHHGTQTACYDV